MRLDNERKEALQPKRIDYAVHKLMELGYNVEQPEPSKLIFHHKGEPVYFFPYSGCYSGKTIKDGRGLKKLLKQLNQ